MTTKLNPVNHRERQDNFNLIGETIMAKSTQDGGQKNKTANKKRRSKPEATVGMGDKTCTPLTGDDLIKIGQELIRRNQVYRVTVADISGVPF